MVVSPEGTASKSNRSGPARTALFIAALAVVAIGFVALGHVGSGDRVAVELTTTTSTTLGELAAPIDPDSFSVSQVVTGEHLDWTMAGEFDGYPIGLTEHDGHFFLFTTERGGRGMIAWRSNDGVEWESLGPVLSDEHVVSTVASTPDRLVAAGHRGNDTTLLIWSSRDGTRWTVDEIPTDSASPYLQAYATAVGSTEEMLMVAAVTALDTSRLVEDRLDEIGIDVDMGQTRWDVHWAGEDGHVLEVGGPLGLEATEIALDDLNLTPQEREWLANGFDRVPRTDIWVRRAGSRWQRSAIEGAYTINSIITRPDETFLAVGHGTVGPLARVSEDGLGWTPATKDSVPGEVSNWDDYLVGLAGSVRPDVLVSNDGRAWEALGLAERFPLPISWTATTMGAGDEGLAIAVEGQETVAPPATVEMPVLRTDKDANLTLDFEEGTFVLETGSGTFVWDMALRATGGTDQAGMEVDLEERIVTFSDPDSGEPIASVFLAALEQAQEEYITDRFQKNKHRTLVFTPNGVDWTIQDVAAEIGDAVIVAGLEVAADRILAIVIGEDSPLLAGSSPLSVGSAPERRISTPFQLWTAVIP